MKPTASPVPVWGFNEDQALRARANLATNKPSERDYARRLFHSAFWRIG